MINPKFVLALFAILFVACGCAQKPVIGYQFDPRADFTTFKTYAVEPTQSPTLDLRTLEGKPLAQVIQQSIERQLEAKGVTKSAAASADLLVRWTGQIKYDAADSAVANPSLDVDLNDPDSGFILHSATAGTGVPSEITKGGIRIDLVNAKSKQVVWRGGVGAVLKDKRADPDRVAALEAAMTKLFKNYPPKDSKK